MTVHTLHSCGGTITLTMALLPKATLYVAVCDKCAARSEGRVKRERNADRGAAPRAAKEGKKQWTPNTPAP